MGYHASQYFLLPGKFHRQTFTGSVVGITANSARTGSVMGISAALNVTGKPESYSGVYRRHRLRRSRWFNVKIFQV